MLVESKGLQLQDLPPELLNAVTEHVSQFVSPMIKYSC